MDDELGSLGASARGAASQVMDKYISKVVVRWHRHQVAVAACHRLAEPFHKLAEPLQVTASNHPRANIDSRSGHLEALDAIKSDSPKTLLVF